MTRTFAHAVRDSSAQVLNGAPPPGTSTNGHNGNISKKNSHALCAVTHTLSTHLDQNAEEPRASEQEPPPKSSSGIFAMFANPPESKFSSSDAATDVGVRAAAASVTQYSAATMLNVYMKMLEEFKANPPKNPLFLLTSASTASRHHHHPHQAAQQPRQVQAPLVSSVPRGVIPGSSNNGVGGGFFPLSPPPMSWRRGDSAPDPPISELASRGAAEFPRVDSKNSAVGRFGVRQPGWTEDDWSALRSTRTGAAEVEQPSMPPPLQTAPPAAATQPALATVPDTSSLCWESLERDHLLRSALSLDEVSRSLGLRSSLFSDSLRSATSMPGSLLSQVLLRSQSTVVPPPPVEAFNLLTNATPSHPLSGLNTLGNFGFDGVVGGDNSSLDFSPKQNPPLNFGNIFENLLTGLDLHSFDRVVHNSSAVPGSMGAPPADVPLLDTLESNSWFYRDTQGNVQGPFSSAKMRHWALCNWFHPTLLIRRATSPWVPFGVLFPPGGPEPFTYDPCSKPFVLPSADLSNVAVENAPPTKQKEESLSSSPVSADSFYSPIPQKQQEQPATNSRPPFAWKIPSQVTMPPRPPQQINEASPTQPATKPPFQRPPPMESLPDMVQVMREEEAEQRRREEQAKAKLPEAKVAWNFAKPSAAHQPPEDPFSLAIEASVKGPRNKDKKKKKEKKVPLEEFLQDEPPSSTAWHSVWNTTKQYSDDFVTADSFESPEVQSQVDARFRQAPRRPAAPQATLVSRTPAAPPRRSGAAGRPQETVSRVQRLAKRRSSDGNEEDEESSDWVTVGSAPKKPLATPQRGPTISNYPVDFDDSQKPKQQPQRSKQNLSKDGDDVSALLRRCGLSLDNAMIDFLKSLNNEEEITEILRGSFPNNTQVEIFVPEFMALVANPFVAVKKRGRRQEAKF